MRESDQITFAGTGSGRQLLADVLTREARAQAVYEVLTTDGLCLTLGNPSEDNGRIVTSLNVSEEHLGQRQDLRRIDGCSIDFAASVGIGEGEGINCRVLSSGGVIAFLRLPGIVQVRTR